MLRKFRFLAIITALSIVTGQLFIVDVHAAQTVADSKEIRELSEIRITDLKEPVIGEYLDIKALVQTRENISWEIPVIWTDDLGNTAYIAREGRTYTPNFIFFVPQGYTIRNMSSDGRFSVKIPEFLTETFGYDSLVFIMDPGRSITYITFIPMLKGQSIDPDAYSEKAPRTLPVSEESTEEDYDSGNSGSGGTSGENTPSPSPVDPSDIPEQVRIHCSQGAIDTLGVDILEDLVSLVKNKLEPQAVNLLINSFDAYKNNVDNLGKQIGLYIYHEKGSVDGDKTPEGALAYVSDCYYDEGNDNLVYKYYIGIDTKTIMEKDPETGEWHYNEDEKDTFSNTIVHEMSHAFMDDYSRYGMHSRENGFPRWFGEGSASAVENVYQYRSNTFQALGDTEGNTYDADSYRYTEPVKYTMESILNKYTHSGEIAGEEKYTLTGGDTAGEYVSGYLAYVYLGYLTAMYDGKTDVLNYSDVYSTPEDITDDIVTVDIDKIRYGANKILEMLHEGNSLDSIIAKCSSTGADNTASIYTDTTAFENSFIAGADEGEVSRQIYDSLGNTVNVMGSLAFCGYYLNYLESQSEEGDWTKLANGSILKQDMHYCSPLDWDKEETSNLYKIIDVGGMVASTADEDFAYYNTGGRSEIVTGSSGITGSSDPQDPKIVEIYDNSQNEPQAAAKPEAGDESANTSEVIIENTNTPEESVENVDASNAFVNAAADETLIVTDTPSADNNPDNAPVVNEIVFVEGSNTGNDDQCIESDPSDNEGKDPGNGSDDSCSKLS